LVVRHYRRLCIITCLYQLHDLSTARSEKRAKEVGIRKTVGSLRQHSSDNFLASRLVVALLAFVLSIGLIVLSLPFFNRLADKEMSIPGAILSFWLITLCFTFFTGLVSGSYPAF